jgi:fructokinase
MLSCNMNYKVTSVGEILWDIFGSNKKAGGSSMNVSLHLHKQGVKTEFISAVGQDPNGLELIKFLEDQQHSTKLIQTHPTLPTSTVEVHLDETHQATYMIVEPVAWDGIKLTPEAIEQVEQSDAFVYCSLTCRNEESRTTILSLIKHAKFKVFDINLRPPFYTIETLRPLLEAADLLKINEDEIKYLQKELKLTGTSEEQLCKQLSLMFNIPIICITLGDKGAMVWENEHLYTHNGYKVKVEDTVGAGDSFLATYISSMLQGFPIETTLDRACTVGAYVASQAGANPDYDDQIYSTFQEQK